MTTWQIVLGIIIGLITGLVVSECCDVSPWVARKLVRWSARRRYVPPTHAELRAEELAAYIDDCPGRLFKLIIALGFAAAAAVVTRKVAPTVAPLDPLWQPTTLTVPVHYEEGGEWREDRRRPKAHVVHQSWCQLTDEVCKAAKEVGVGSRSWRRCVKELRRITGDERWMLVAKNLELLEEINDSSAKIRRAKYMEGTGAPGSRDYIVHYWSFPTSSTIMRYQAAVETARAEIRRLTSDFLLSSVPR